MKILIIGSGGREHALAWALSRDGENELICAPGNPGMAELGELFPVSVSDSKGLLDLAIKQDADLAVIGPEAPLVKGIADLLRENDIPCFGPGSEGARLEGSKWFAKEIMGKASVPTAAGDVFADAGSALEFIDGSAQDYVIKADGLAAGKGVFIPKNTEEAEDILRRIFQGELGEAGNRVVIEERLQGREISILALCSGEQFVLLPPSRDHKRIGEGGTGLNTGGMGAVCPPPDIDEGLTRVIERDIVSPVLFELASRGIDYRGVLYAGLMLTETGPKVLEFNVRFGDPETQAVLPLLKSDLAELCMKAALGEPLPDRVDVSDSACACVVMASGGYPVSYEKGFPIHGLKDVKDSLVFHAGTARVEEGLVTSGGRVLSVASLGDTLEEALRKAYGEIDKIQFENCYFRRDIGR